MTLTAGFSLRFRGLTPFSCSWWRHCFYLWFAIWIVKTNVITMRTIESNSKSFMLSPRFRVKEGKSQAPSCFLPAGGRSLGHMIAPLQTGVKGRPVLTAGSAGDHQIAFVLSDWGLFWPFILPFRGYHAITHNGQPNPKTLENTRFFGHANTQKYADQIIQVPSTAPYYDVTLRAVRREKNPRFLGDFSLYMHQFQSWVSE